MMGVIRDPKVAFLRTVNDTSNTIAAQRLYGEVQDLLAGQRLETDYLDYNKVNVPSLMVTT